MSRLDAVTIDGDPTPVHEAVIKAALEVYLRETEPQLSAWKRPGDAGLRPVERPISQPGQSWKPLPGAG